MSKRIFTAIDVPPDIVDRLRKHHDRALPVRWIRPENLHITLNFLGDLDDLGEHQALEIAANVASRHKPIEIELTRIVPFRTMIWAEVKANKRLAALQADLARRFSDARVGEPDSREYHPHVSLARSRENLESFAAGEPLSGMSFIASHIVVFESELHPESPTYVSIDAFELGGDLNTPIHV